MDKRRQILKRLIREATEEVLLEQGFFSRAASAVKGAVSSAAGALKGAVARPAAPAAPAAGAPAAGAPAPAAPAAPAAAAAAGAGAKITKQHIEAYKALMKATNEVLKKTQSLEKYIPALEKDATRWPPFQRGMEEIVQAIRGNLDIVEVNIAKDLESRLIDKDLEAAVNQMSAAQDKIFSVRVQKQPNIPEVKEAITALILAIKGFTKLLPNALGKMDSFLVRLGIREQIEKQVLKQIIQEEIKFSYKASK